MTRSTMRVFKFFRKALCPVVVAANLLLLVSFFATSRGAQIISTMSGVVTGIPPQVIPTPLFDLPFSEGTGNPAYSGTDGSGTCSFTDLGWATTPTAGEGNGTTTIGNCGPGLDNLPAFTITACVNPDTYGENNAGRIINKVTAGPTLSWQWLIASSISGARFQVFAAAGGNTQFWDVTFPVASGWRHLAITVDNCASLGSCLGQYYIDGVAVTTTPGTTGTGSGARPDDSAYDVLVMNQAAVDRTWDGPMYKLAVYSGARTGGQIAAIAAAANCGN